MNGLLNLKKTFNPAVRRGFTAARVDLPGARINALALWKRLPSPWRFWFENPAGAAAGWRLGGAGRGPVSWLAFGAPLWRFEGFHDGTMEQDGIAGRRRVSCADPADFLASSLRNIFAGGDEDFPAAVGFWGYESAYYFDPVWLKQRAAERPAGAGLPNAVFSWSVPPFRLRIDGEGATLWCAGPSAGENLKRARAWADKIRSLPGKGSIPEAVDVPAGPRNRPVSGRAADFEARARRIKALIARGDIYQANLSHPVSLPWSPRWAAGDFFAALSRLNPSPYSVLMEFPGWALVSGSPELLLRIEGDRAETRPIAGTRPRGDTRARDRRLSGALLLSPKERAEHVMLVDLERNDLGRVCRAGSVRVTEQMAVEKYSHVFHIVSQVEGRLRRGADGFAALKAVFPGGTITGCPKIECMKILTEIESGRRGPFYGSAGWTAPSGDMELNILIRSAVLNGERMSFRVGAGIVADSRPAREWRETWHKARALLAAYAVVARKGARP